MNKSKIEWCDYTWNPVTGCLHGCSYCYAAKIANRFGMDFAPELGDPDLDGCKYDSPIGINTMLELNKPYRKMGRLKPFPMAFLPTFHKYRLDEPIKKTKGQKIFVCSMADLFGEWVPDAWIQEVFKACEAAPQHTYIFLTKNPKRFTELQHKIPLPTSYKYWYGTTITSHEDTHRLAYLAGLANKTFISIEPLLGEVGLENVQFGQYATMNVLEGRGVNTKNCCQSIPNAFCKPIDWVIIGAQTGAGDKPPKPEWVQSIIAQCRASEVPVFLKNNLNWPEKIQEFPKAGA